MARKADPGRAIDNRESERPGEEQGNQPEEQGDEERESIWSIPVSLKRLYFALFTVQMFIVMAWLIRTAIVDDSLPGIPEKIASIWLRMAPMAVSSAAIALTITDTWKTSMVLGTWLEETLEKRRQRQIKAAVDKAVKEAVEEATQEVAEARRQLRDWWAWNQRRVASEAAGEEFNEPPPGADDPENEDPRSE